jgi:hypothetical protein
MLHRDERRNGTSKCVRETEAEAVSFVVCKAIGLESGTAAQDYIQLYEGDAKPSARASTASSKRPAASSPPSPLNNRPRLANAGRCSRFR